MTEETAPAATGKKKKSGGTKRTSSGSGRKPLFSKALQDEISAAAVSAGVSPKHMKAMVQDHIGAFLENEIHGKVLDRYFAKHGYVRAAPPPDQTNLPE